MRTRLRLAPRSSRRMPPRISSHPRLSTDSGPGKPWTLLWARTVHTSSPSAAEHRESREPRRLRIWGSRPAGLRALPGVGGAGARVSPVAMGTSSEWPDHRVGAADVACCFMPPHPPLRRRRARGCRRCRTCSSSTCRRGHPGAGAPGRDAPSVLAGRRMYAGASWTLCSSCGSASRS